MTKEVNKNSKDMNKEKEFLKINDMMEKLGVTRMQFWKIRKAVDVPSPVVKTPQMWLASKVTELYENRAFEKKPT